MKFQKVTICKLVFIRRDPVNLSVPSVHIFRCPHIAMTGNICVYCPGGPDSDFEYSTQSYTGYEPTSMRAIRARYHPFLQTRHRVEQLKQLGHSVDKVREVGTCFLVDIVCQCFSMLIVCREGVVGTLCVWWILFVAVLFPGNVGTLSAVAYLLFFFVFETTKKTLFLNFLRFSNLHQ